MALSASRRHDSHDSWDGGPSAEGLAAPSTLVLDGAGAASVRMPDASFLTDGQFVRSGADLKIELPDGRAALVEGYFQGAQQPDLVGPDGGAALSPSLVKSFLASIAPGQYAQAAPTPAEQPIGRVDAIEGHATAVRSDGTRVALEKGDPVYQGDVIETGGDASAIRLLFADKTMFALGPEARLALDEMVFDSASHEGSVQFSILKGVFIFASGQIAKTDNTDMTVTTPVATIGIRGTEVAGRIADGDSQFTIIDGAIEVTTRAGSVALDSRGETTDVAGIDSAPGAPYLLTPTQYAEAYKAVAGIAAEYFSGGAPGGGEVPDDGGNGAGEQRGDLDPLNDGHTTHASADDDSESLAFARTLGDDTTTLFGSTWSSGDAWSDLAWAGTTDASKGLSGDNFGDIYAWSDSSRSGSGSPADGDGGATNLFVTMAAGGSGDMTASGSNDDPLLVLAADLTLGGGTTGGASFDSYSSLSDNGSGGLASPFRIAQGDQPPAWGNAYWGADGGPDAADMDFGWLRSGSKKPAVTGYEEDELDDLSGNEIQALAGLGGDANLVLAEGVTLVVSHKSINGNFQDLSESIVLPDFGAGSSATITGDELGLTGVAGSAEILLTRDATNSVDVSLNSGWNSIQNIRVESDLAGDVAVSNFVHTDVQLGDGGDSTIVIADGKRGFVTTGDGDDYVSIQAASDGFAGSATFDVHTGAGDDTLVFAGAPDGLSKLAFDGGAGSDTLWLTGSLTEFDLTTANYDITNVERLDVSGTADVSALLSSEVVAAMAGGVNDLTGTANTLVVDGDSGDTVQLGSGWSTAGTMDIDGAGYTIYEHADGARVVADNDITVA